MTATYGVRLLPCGHHRVKLPREPGTFRRECDICKAVHWLTVTPASPSTTAKLGGNIALFARWEH